MTCDESRRGGGGERMPSRRGLGIGCIEIQEIPYGDVAVFESHFGKNIRTVLLHRSAADSQDFSNLGIVFSFRDEGSDFLFAFA